MNLEGGPNTNLDGEDGVVCAVAYVARCDDVDAPADAVPLRRRTHDRAIWTLRCSGCGRLSERSRLASRAQAHLDGCNDGHGALLEAVDRRLQDFDPAAGAGVSDIRRSGARCHSRGLEAERDAGALFEELHPLAAWARGLGALAPAEDRQRLVYHPGREYRGVRKENARSLTVSSSRKLTNGEARGPPHARHGWLARSLTCCQDQDPCRSVFLRLARPPASAVVGGGEFSRAALGAHTPHRTPAHRADIVKGLDVIDRRGQFLTHTQLDHTT